MFKFRSVELKLKKQCEQLNSLDAMTEKFSHELIEVNARISAIKLNTRNIYAALCPSVHDENQFMEFVMDLITQGYTLDDLVDKFKIPERELIALQSWARNVNGAMLERPIDPVT